MAILPYLCIKYKSLLALIVTINQTMVACCGTPNHLPLLLAYRSKVKSLLQNTTLIYRAS